MSALALSWRNTSPLRQTTPSLWLQGFLRCDLHLSWQDLQLPNFWRPQPQEWWSWRSIPNNCWGFQHSHSDEASVAVHTWEHISAYNFFTDWNSDYQTYTPKYHMRSLSSTSIGGGVEHHYPILCKNQNWKHSQVGSPRLDVQMDDQRSSHPCANHNSQY